MPPNVVQEVFSAVSSNIARFQRDRAGGRFRGWLWTITRNKIQDHYRSRPAGKKRPAEPTPSSGSPKFPNRRPGSPPTPKTRAHVSSLFQRALAAVHAEFEQHTWEAFWRATVLRQPTREVAAALGMLPSAVRNAKSRVLRRIRAVLGDLIE